LETTLDFLLEIGTEEIPARMIVAAQDELARRVRDLVVREQLADSPHVSGFSTPRRLAVLARGLRRKQADLQQELQGPSVSVAAKNPKAVEAFARKTGLAPKDLKTVMTPKGEYLAATVVLPGRNATEILAEAIPQEIAALYWPKSMYWRAKNERFVRPVRWIVALLDGEIVPVEFGGKIAAAESRGHRQLSPGPVMIERAGRYAEALAQARVLMPAEREHNIRKALDAATRAIPGARWREDREVLGAVVNLTEFPSVVLGGFDHDFLSLPEEVLVTVMRDHQKYFAVEDEHGKLAPYFLAVLNTAGDPGGLIRHGNERVLRARFRDARFFWDTDQKTPLAQRISALKNVTFQKDLGSYFEKAQRMAGLAEALASCLASAGMAVDQTAVREAALLAKTDLTTELVKEFTELQGIIGGLYVRAQGGSALSAVSNRLSALSSQLSALGSQREPPEEEDCKPTADGYVARVADAIYDHYKPVSMEDSAPRTLEGAVVSLADKADSIAGMFALGLQPSGSKDPFALRRQANGIVKTIAEHKLPLSLADLFQRALKEYSSRPSALSPQPKAESSRSQQPAADTQEPPVEGRIAAFLRERLEFYLRDALGFAYDVVNAVLAAGADDVADAVARARAVALVRPSEDFEAISTAFKRMKNILRQAVETGKWTAQPDAVFGVVVAAEGEPEEKDLTLQAAGTAAVARELRNRRHYEPALIEISRLRPAVDRFFDKVMVMAEDEALRRRRLALLQKLVNEFSSIADFSEIVTSR
jgi:glycyl-tRNA synthetase beta chain